MLRLIQLCIAKSLECFFGGSFHQCEDSVRIRWHDTCGAGFDYRFYIAALGTREGGYSAFYGYYFDTYLGYDTISPRSFAQYSIGLYDTVRRYLPPSTGLPSPWSVETRISAVLISAKE